MAIITTGSIVADIRGKVGTEIYSRNRGGAYVKNYVVPANPATNRQTARRNQMAYANTRWIALSEANKKIWESYASTHPVLNKLGKCYFPSARQLFIQRFINGLRADDSEVTTPYTPSPWPSFGITFGTISGTQFRISPNMGFTDYNWFAQMYVSDQFGNTIRSFNTVPRQRWSVLYYDNTPDFNYYTTWNFIYGSGPLIAGRRIFFEYEPCSVLSGDTLPRTRIILTVT